MDGLKIGELAHQAGVQTSAIRYYESLGLISPPRRMSGWRLYAPAVLGRLQFIRSARDLGFSLEEIRTLLSSYADDTPPAEIWRGLARRKLPEVEATLHRAQDLQLLLLNSLNCSCESIDECLKTKCAPDSQGLTPPSPGLPASP